MRIKFTKYHKLFICLLCTLFFSNFPDHVFAVEHNLSDSENYNFLVVGPTEGSTVYLSLNGIQTADLNSNGKPDLLIAADAGGLTSDIGYLYVIYDDLLASFTTKTIDLSDSNNYSLRFDGPSYPGAHNVYLTQGNFKLADVDNDQKLDVIISAFGSDYDENHSRGNSGSVFVIYNSLIQTFTQKNIDLGNEDNYSLQFHGPSSSYALSRTGVDVADFDDDGLMDYVIGSDENFANPHGAGSLWLVYGSLLETLPTKHIDFINSANYSHRIRGVNVDDMFTAKHKIIDFDNDSKPDLAIGAPGSDFNSRTDSGSLYLINNSTVRGFQDKDIYLSSIDNYSLRIDGAAISDQLSFGDIASADLNNNGKNDLVIGSLNSISYLWILSDTLFSSFSEKAIDIGVSQNYSYKIEEGISSSRLGLPSGSTVGDFDGDNKNDLLLGNPFVNNYFGSLYLLNNNSLNNSLSKNVNLANIAGDITRYNGATMFSLLSLSSEFSDITADGKPDLFIGAPMYGGQTQGGMYIIYNFPHTVSLDQALPTNVIDKELSLTGRVVASDSVTNIKGVQYSIDENTFSGNWKQCEAEDGGFDSIDESFSCSISLEAIADGQHHIFIRSYDDNLSYTAESNYVSTNQFNLDLVKETVNVTESGLIVETADPPVEIPIYNPTNEVVEDTEKTDSNKDKPNPKDQDSENSTLYYVLGIGSVTLVSTLGYFYFKKV